jgi:5-hydroxyisourate hydrolase-like protein (transthyretin family)
MSQHPLRPRRSRSMCPPGALACTFTLLAMLALSPKAQAAEQGAISGTVTSASTHEPLRGIEVTVYEAGGSIPIPTEFAVTNQKGEYTVDGLASGSYVVEFSAGFEGEGGNYVTQFYENATSPTSAKRVSVTAPDTTAEINAALQVGGEIKGEATASEDFVPLKGIGVTVYDGKEPVAYATTGANGQYTVVGLATGSYKVGFSAGYEGGELEEGPGSQQNFIAQYYSNRSTLEAAEPVAVTQEGVHGHQRPVAAWRRDRRHRH